MAIEIQGRVVGGGERPFIIAELSGNHGGSLDMALKLVDKAADAGVDAVKLQTYTADTMTIDVDLPEFRIDDANSPWDGNTLYSLYERAHTPWEWHAPIFAHARDRGLIAFSTPFDRSAIDFLEDLAVPCYKISSFEIVDLPLISQAASTGRPMIISTGMATLAEIDEAVTAARSAGCNELLLMKCTSTYPASPEASNLASIEVLRERYGCEVGLSDHTLGVGVAVASVALGATAIEKHIVISRRSGTVDSAFSMEPDEMRLLVAESERAWQAVGEPTLGPSKEEMPSLRFRRSLFFVRDVAAGSLITSQDVRAIRPGKGLPPKHLAEIIGRATTRAIPRGTPVTWDALTL